MVTSTFNPPPFILRFYPDPSLSKRCEEVHLFGLHTENLAIAMIAAMHAHQGVGLAANQMGQSERLFVISGSILDDGVDLAVFNPKIIERLASCIIEEGCLSLPGVAYVIPGRASEIGVTFQSADGTIQSRVFKGLAAICFQHELDHLDGLTMLDRLSALKADRIKSRLVKEAKAQKRI